MKITIRDRETREEIIDTDRLMNEADMERYCDFEDIAIQGDGTLIICNKCGDFGYLDKGKYLIIMDAT